MSLIEGCGLLRAPRILLLGGLGYGTGRTHVLRRDKGPATSLGHNYALLHPDTADDAQSGKRRLLEALWRKPNLLKKFRRILEEALEEKLESMGVSRVSLCFHCQHLQHQPRGIQRLP